MPAAELQPYDPRHPVYRIGQDSDQVWASSAAVVRDMTFRIDTGADSPPVYVGDAADPSWTFTIVGNGNTQVFTGVKAPADIAPGTGVDFPLVVLDDVTKTEYRQFQAVVTGSPTFTVTGAAGGVGLYGQNAGVDGGPTIHGVHAGSAQSYLVGMVRPHEIAAGRIPHAIRCASSYVNANFVLPATASDQGTSANEIPMGTIGRIRSTVDLSDPAIEAIITAGIDNELGREACRTILRAMQEYGIIYLDGSATGQNLYFEGAETADWEAVMGPVNGFGTWNDIAFAIEDIFTEIGADKLDFYTGLGYELGRDTPTHLASHTASGVTVSSLNITGVTGGTDRFYYLTIGCRPTANVTAVTGGGLTWTEIKTQSGARSQSFGKVWVAQGSPGDDFTIAITLSTATVVSAVVSVIDGALIGQDAPTVTSANTLGIDGPTGGVDTDNQALDLTAPIPSGGRLVISSLVSRVALTSNDASYTAVGTADSHPAGDGARVIVRQLVRESRVMTDWNDRIGHRASANVDWVMFSGTIAGPVPAATSYGRGRLVSTDPGPSRLRGSRL